MLILVIAGAGCFVFGLFGGGATISWVGTIFFLLSAIAGLMTTSCLRRDATRMSVELDEMARQGKFSTLRAGTREFSRLCGALNGVIEAADARVQDAGLKAKSLEIELKVATAERQHAEAIIYSISDAVLVTDTFDDVVLANESAARTFAFDLTKASRSPLQQVVGDAKMVDLIREMRQANSKSGRRIVEHIVKDQQGEKTFKVTMSNVADQGDNAAGVVTVLHDMTREKEVAEMKNDFVSSVSHELRTPLASIKAYVEMLIDGEAEDERTKGEFYEIIQGEANRLGRLIDNILNISRIESGLVKVNKQPQSLVMIVKEAIDVINPQARTKHITVTEQLMPAIYQTQADKDMLYQAVLNLLSNAVKYTPEGGSINVSTILDEARKMIVVKISDTGVGIPPKDLPFVFDKFYRVEANNRMAKGTGLGLSLVKHIVETVHRGRIFVESSVGKGTTFGFELDLCE
jgi:two-component system phosphate regulon sensor histidine kinase PhoR